MNDHPTHNDEQSRFFKNAQIPYSRSKEDVWKDMVAQMEERQHSGGRTRSLLFYRAAAAVVVLLVGLAAFARFYTATLQAPAGQHVTKTLPGGSKVHLNAGTELSYHPHWWRFARILELEGEAYFEVEAGNRFTVKSPQGATRVLGTRFNIYARHDAYRVFCLSGEVEVETRGGKKKSLASNQSVSVSKKGEVKYRSDLQPEHAIAWTKNRFVYTSAPLGEVLKEMERQFDISIQVDASIAGERYTGNFQRGSSPQTILEMIVRPFGLEVQQIHQTKFRITQNRN